jgi:hypothetical protein
LRSFKQKKICDLFLNVQHQKIQPDDNNQRLPLLMSMSVQVSKPADFFCCVFGLHPPHGIIKQPKKA